MQSIQINFHFIFIIEILCLLAYKVNFLMIFGIELVVGIQIVGLRNDLRNLSRDSP